MPTRLDPAPAADPPPVAGTAPMLDSRQLRKIADAVAGYRGDPHFRLVLTQDAGGSLAHEVLREDPGYRPDAVVIPCHTPPDALRPPLAAATIQAVGGPAIDLLHLELGDDEDGVVHTADAVFWGDSSVEKFVVPYYASVYGSQAGEAVTELLNTYNGVKAPGPELEAAVDGAPNATEVYGLVHMPRSDYVDLAEAPADPQARPMRHDRFAALAFNRRTGEHRVVAVEEYRKRGAGA